jgi:aspartyl/asparaginyl beta-hydroxylase (cupin superfamily)
MTSPNGDTPGSTEGTEGTPSKDTLMSRAYSAASRRLREGHQDEFNDYMVEETERLGIKWTPKPTPQDRALQEITKLLETIPGLAEKLAIQLAKQSR